MKRSDADRPDTDRSDTDRDRAGRNEAAREANRAADTAAGPEADNLPSDEPHQVAEEQLNRHYGPLRRPDRARGD